MKYFSLPFVLIVFSCSPTNQLDDALDAETKIVDTSQANLTLQDVPSTEYGPSGYIHLLDIISEYSFNPNLIATYDEAMEWLSSEGVPTSTAYSEEESHYNIDFVILATEENASCSFHFEYSEDGDYSTYRHIIQNVDEDLKSAFMEELKVWYVRVLELESIEAKCYHKKWGATGYVWEEEMQHGIIQSSIQRSPADDSYPWIELRRNGYKDVADDELVGCD
jgi:hypothetical protein